MPDYDPHALAAPLPGEAPCGPDLEYDASFLAMQQAGEGKPETQYGDTIQPAQDPDWPLVMREALSLAERTRDLRVATWLTRAGARLDGFPGAVRGLQLAHALLETHWADVHPKLDASEGNDPTARMSALMPLGHPAAGLADLRSATLTGKRNALAIRQIELATGAAEPRAGETVPSAAGVRQGVAEAIAELPSLALQLDGGHAAVKGIATVLETHLDASQTPDLGELRKLLQRIAETGRAATGAEAPADATEAAGASAPAGAVAVRAAGTIASREDASRMLERVCEWIEANEPSHPAPLLIRRAQRLLSMDFLEIIKDIAPDGLGQIERLAGTANT